MAEEEKVFSSSLKYAGIFKFSDFYNFSHEWISEELGISPEEEKYEEKIKGDEKEITVEWGGGKQLTDYFKEKIKLKFTVRRLQKVIVKKGGAEIETNKGDIKIDMKGILVKDYQGKFEMTGFKKFLRSVYEKYIIPSAVNQFKDKVTSDCDEFLSQAKSYLDLEGKK